MDPLPRTARRRSRPSGPSSCIRERETGTAAAVTISGTDSRAGTASPEPSSPGRTIPRPGGQEGHPGTEDETGGAEHPAPAERVRGTGWRRCADQDHEHRDPEHPTDLAHAGVHGGGDCVTGHPAPRPGRRCRGSGGAPTPSPLRTWPGNHCRGSSARGRPRRRTRGRRWPTRARPARRRRGGHAAPRAARAPRPTPPRRRRRHQGQARPRTRRSARCTATTGRWSAGRRRTPGRRRMRRWRRRSPRGGAGPGRPAGCGCGLELWTKPTASQRRRPRVTASTPALVQPQSLALTMTVVSRPMARRGGGTPRSGSRRRPGDRLSTSLRPSAIRAATPTGRLTRKAHRQPPTSPGRPRWAGRARPPRRRSRPTARRRERRSERERLDHEGEGGGDEHRRTEGLDRAAATSHQTEPAAAQHSEDSVKSATPSDKQRRRPTQVGQPPNRMSVAARTML